MNLGKRIKELRKKAGYSQEKLADILNITTGAICKWESDLSCPDLANLVCLAQVFAVSVDYLLDCNITIANEKSIIEALDSMIKRADYQYDTKKIMEIESKFPNSFLIIYNLANYLFNYGFEDNQTDVLELALKYSFRALSLCEASDDFFEYQDEIKANIISIYQRIGEYERAIEFIKKNHVSNANFALGCCYDGLKKYDVALEYLSKDMVISLVNLINGCANEAEILFKLGNKSEASSLLKWALNIIDGIVLDKNSVLSGAKVVILALEAVVNFPDEAFHSSLEKAVELSIGYKRNKEINKDSLAFCHTSLIPVSTFNDDLIKQIREIGLKLLDEQSQSIFIAALEKILSERTEENV